MNADNIIFVKDGEILEQGNHEQLIAHEGEYWALVKNQLNLSVG